MKKLCFLISFVAVLIIFNACSKDEIFPEQENAKVLTETKLSNLQKGLDSWEDEIIRLRKKMRQFHNFRVAIAQGYDTDVTGYVPQMGHHYLKGSLLDDDFELEKPELLMYAPDGMGGMKFVGVEYAVPIADINNPPEAPEGFTGDSDDWHINYEFNLWTLHVWVGLDNPNGIFEPLNPTLP